MTPPESERERDPGGDSERVTTDPPACPDCDEPMVDSIDYHRGHKRADGWRCEAGGCPVVHVDYSGDVTRMPI